MTPGRANVWPHGHNLNKFGSGHEDYATLPNIKALGLVVSDKKFLKFSSRKPILACVT